MIDIESILASSQLPTLPAVAVKLLELSRNPRSEMADVVCVIKADPAISAKILKSTNSSYFGFASKVASIDRAVPLLGTAVVTSLALSFSLAESAMTKGPAAEHYRSFWLQSLVQAVAAEIFGKKGGVSRSNEFDPFLAGLLMDLGRLALLSVAPKEYIPVLDEACANSETPLWEVERRTFGFDHVDVGVKLMEKWKLPATLIDVVKLHHASLESLLAGYNGAPSRWVYAAGAAAAAGDYFCTEGKGQALERLVGLSENLGGMSRADVETILGTVRERMDGIADLFSIDANCLGDPADLITQANEQLVNLTIREHIVSTQSSIKQQMLEMDLQELERSNETLEKHALRDPLTGAFNRRFFDECLQKEISRCARHAATVGVIFLDIDRFKPLNDEFGHPFGDEVLKKTASAIGKVLRRSDILFRYGGEEFVILAPQPTEKGIEKVAERVRMAVESETIMFGDRRVNVTISLGTALALPGREEGSLFEDLIAAADEAMYQAKESGRNRVCSRSLIDSAEQRLAQRISDFRFSRWITNRGLLDVPTVSAALVECQVPAALIGQLARQQGYLCDVEVDQILADQKQSGERFGTVARRLGLLSDDQLAHLLALQQENARSVCDALVKAGCLERDSATILFQEFEAQLEPLKKSAMRVTVENPAAEACQPTA